MAATDARVVCCNTTEGTSVYPPGAKMYVGIGWSGGGYQRLMVYGRSRGGRFVHMWMPTSRLTNFRFKTIPPEHPLFAATASDGPIANYYTPDDLACMAFYASSTPDAETKA